MLASLHRNNQTSTAAKRPGVFIEGHNARVAISFPADLCPASSPLFVVPSVPIPFFSQRAVPGNIAMPRSRDFNRRASIFWFCLTASGSGGAGMAPLPAADFFPAALHPLPASVPCAWAWGGDGAGRTCRCALNATVPPSGGFCCTCGRWHVLWRITRAACRQTTTTISACRTINVSTSLPRCARAVLDACRWTGRFLVYSRAFSRRLLPLLRVCSRNARTHTAVWALPVYTMVDM